MQQKTDLTLIEAIRKHPAMYAGSTSVRGFNNLLQNLIQDVFENTEANYFSFELLGNLKGIFTFNNLQQNISDNIATDVWKKDNLSYLDYELATLNALSKYFELKVFDKENNKLFHQVFEKGQIKQGEITNQRYEVDVYEITFDLDDSIFDIYEPLNANFYLEQIRNLAYLCKEKTLEVIYPVSGRRSNSIFKFENGMKDKIDVERLKGYCGTYLDTYIEKTFEDFIFETAFCFRETSVDESFLISYVNYHYTHENGTHADGLLKGIASAIKIYINNHDLDKRDLKNGLVESYIFSQKELNEVLVATIHIKMKRPLFYGSTKNKLISKEIIAPLTKHISQTFLEKMESDKDSTDNLLRLFRHLDYQ